MNFTLDSNITNSSDFEAFLSWLTDSDEAENRLRLYKDFALASGTKENELARRELQMGPSEFLKKEKAALILSISGKFVRQLVERANDFSREGLSKDVTAASLAFCRNEVSGAKRLLAKFHEAVTTEIFSVQLRAANLTDKAINELVATFSSDWGLEPLSVIKNAVERASQVEKEEGIRDFKKYIESPERRADLYRKENVREKNELDDEQKGLGRFAPLLEFMRKHLMPKERAELLARMSAYVESGWAQMDLAGCESPVEMAQKSKWTKHDALTKWRDLSLKIDRDPPLSPEEMKDVLDAFARRFSELSFKVKVEGSDNPNISSIEKMEGRVTTWEDLTQLAGPKEIDICLLSPEAKTIHMTCATSDPQMFRQDGQLSRYLTALSQECETGFNNDDFKGASIKTTMLAPCITQTSTLVKKGGRPGANIFNDLRSLSLVEDEKLTNAINIVPFLELVTNRDFTNLEIAFDVDLEMVGSSAKRWEDLQNQWSGQGGEVEAIAVFAKETAQIMDMLTRCDYHHTIKKSSTSRSQQTSPEERLPLDLLEISSNLRDRLEKLSQSETPFPKDSRAAFVKLSKSMLKFEKGLLFDSITDEEKTVMTRRALARFGKPPSESKTKKRKF